MERSYVKPKIAVSKCLEFEACRYNGDCVTNHVIQTLMPHVGFVPVCPEVVIGLGVPRETIRLVGDPNHMRLVQPSTGEDLTERMNQFANHSYHHYRR